MEIAHFAMEIVSDCMSWLPSFCAALVFGILIGWSWRPIWAKSMARNIRIAPCESWTASFGYAIGLSRGSAGNQAAKSQLAAGRCRSCSSAAIVPIQKFSNDDWPEDVIKPQSTVIKNLASSVVGERDLLDLYKKGHGKEGGPPWNLMMERSAPGMTYKAWRRDPQSGPTEYKSQTVFEDSTPDLVKDFYWDDEFRSVWDDMLIYSKSLENCMETGAEIVHWVRKFPFFCSDREYLIGRRIYELDDVFYCTTKAVPYDAVPRRDKPLRVDVYNSSWCIRAAQSVKKKGQWSACEVMFFHAEDMHIPKHIAKLGVRQGMWGCVRKMEPGLRKYQAHRPMSKSLSTSARMAQLYTRMPASFFGSDMMLKLNVSTDDRPTHQDGEGVRAEELNLENHAPGWKWLIIGGAIVLACTIDRGMLGRTLVFGLAKKVGKLNQRVR